MSTIQMILKVFGHSYTIHSVRQKTELKLSSNMVIKISKKLIIKWPINQLKLLDSFQEVQMTRDTLHSMVSSHKFPLMLRPEPILEQSTEPRSLLKHTHQNQILQSMNQSATQSLLMKLKDNLKTNQLKLQSLNKNYQMNMLLVVGSNGKRQHNKFGTTFSEFKLNNHQLMHFQEIEHSHSGQEHLKEVFYTCLLTLTPT